MICRWCGEKLDPTQAKCPACGRSTQPASACGGFFDLAPSLEQRLPKGQQGEKPESAVPAGAERPDERTGGGKRLQQKKRRRTAWWLWPAAVAVLAIALAVMIVLYCGARSELDALPQETAEASAEVSASPSGASGANPSKDILAGAETLTSQTTQAVQTAWQEAKELFSENTSTEPTTEPTQELPQWLPDVLRSVNTLFRLH